MVFSKQRKLSYSDYQSSNPRNKKEKKELANDFLKKRVVRRHIEQRIQRMILELKVFGVGKKLSHAVDFDFQRQIQAQ